MKIKPNYYAVLIADVRYNKDLTPNAKLLYAEITALCNMNGKCFASNKYFSELYGKSKTSISKWISQLVAFGYVSVAYTYIDGTKCIDKRYITILNNGIKENLNTPIKENLKDNTTSNNITNNNIYIKEKFINQVMILDCNEEIKQDFIDYWTEGNNKMRYQKQPTFDVNLRLKRWIKNSVKWNTKKQGTSKLDKQIDEWQKAKELLEKIQ
tara:strand:+ start:706 stop:1338 length:633 start_codon:yes stop_codon:yes gene_type:complete